MSSFVENFRKHQRQEKLLTGAFVLCSILAPVSFTWLDQQNIYWTICTATAVAFILGAFAIQLSRFRISQKISSHYEELSVGNIVEKKIQRSVKSRYVITNQGFNHYYLKCTLTGEQLLVSKHRIREDFDIAN